MFGTASWGFREMELEGQLSCVCRLGFEIHELDIENAPGDLPADADAEQLREVRELYESYGIRLLCAATGNDFTLAEESQVRKSVEKVKKVITVCEISQDLCRIFALRRGDRSEMEADGGSAERGSTVREGTRRSALRRDSRGSFRVSRRCGAFCQCDYGA